MRQKCLPAREAITRPQRLFPWFGQEHKMRVWQTLELNLFTRGWIKWARTKQLSPRLERVQTRRAIKLEKVG
jgi:hypothetical protein